MPKRVKFSLIKEPKTDLRTQVQEGGLELNEIV